MTDVTTDAPDTTAEEIEPDAPEERLPITLGVLRQTAIDKAHELVQQIAYPASEAETKRIAQVAETATVLNEIARGIEATIQLRRYRQEGQNKLSSVSEGGNASGPPPKKAKKAKKAK